LQPLRILSAGAAQSAVERIGARFRRETGRAIEADFGAVGAMKARMIAGEPVDAIILTAPLVEELAASGHVVPGSRRDLGTVGTGVAVRAGTPLPDVSDARVLRGNLQAARRIVCPDPAIATAGKVVLRALEIMGIGEQVRPRMRFFPNGYAAMRWLAQSPGLLEIGITQTTEILANAGVTYVGPLPAELQMKTVYAAGIAARAQIPETAGDFLARLTAADARTVLRDAGFELN
jgi:molybdate transport system substrate-binding protein